MLVLPDKKKLVINSKRNADIQAIIPHAKTFTHKGAELLAMTHGVEETLVLRNMGFKKTPAPILHYYDWPGQVTPMSHQRDTAAFMTLHKRALCLNSPGTGKTLSVLWASDYLLTEGVVKKILIVAPLSTLKVVWGKELKHHMPYRSFKIITGDRKKRTKELATPGLQYAIINHDGFTTMHKELDDFDLVIYDESTALKTPGSQRYRIFANYMAAKQPWLWMLTGTPISQNPVDAWTMARLTQSPSVPKSYTSFKDMVMQKISMYRWIPRPNALEICKQVLQPSIRFSLDECTDIPQTNIVFRETELTPHQQRAFDVMRENCLLVFGSGEVVTAANAAVLMSKLLQVTTGVVYDEDGNHVVVDSTNRYDALVELIEEIGGKCIVYVPFTGVQYDLQSRLKASGYDVELVNGSVSKADRDVIFHDFQNTDRIRILLAHPRVASHGLTLTAADSIVWYAPIYSLESYEQANARIRRLNTTGKTTVYHLYATTFERELYKRLQNRQRVLSEFLELVRGENT